MATIAGTIRGIANVSKAFAGAAVSASVRDTREVWLITVDFAAYTGASDDAAINAVGAAIDATARDGRTRTLRWGAPAFAGSDANNQAVFATGAAVQALTVSSDNLTGNLSVQAGTEVSTTSGTTKSVGVLVGVD